MTNSNDNSLEIIRVRSLSASAIDFIVDQYGCFEDEAEDHFVCGKTFVETTRRVLDGSLSRLDVQDLIDRAVGNVWNERDIPMVEASARRSALTTQEKIKAALEGRKPRKIKASNKPTRAPLKKWWV